ncbi:hypothetical protein ACTZWW_05840 [Salinarimonas sp. NSM]|uniref:hypothetical protein n=1 Tax=Salinarimonas sp. NSM TaxID=3458003 RepID=UPI00403724CB
MPASEREVYEHLLARADSARAVTMIAYAVFAEERKHWIDLFRARAGRAPTQSEIDDWVADLPEVRFKKLLDEAATYFDDAARSYLKTEMDGLRDRILQSQIIRQVRAASGWWRQLAIALMTAILAPLIIGAVIVSALAWGTALPSLVDMSVGLREFVPAVGE